ncbi:uncharacterized protein [Pocillopora verrucosa]|uniref:uncharacterized protein n=1 Tax=Pocillopora verrucosa TaxID=203993 RepID=UPI00334198B7
MTVESLLKDLRQSSSLENGLPLRHSPAKKKLKVTEVDHHKVKHKTLPKRRRDSKKRKDRGVVVDLTRAEGNSKDSDVELEEVDSICDVSLDDDNELELCNDADNDMDNDELTGTIHESSARISPRPSQLGESEVQLCDAETRVRTLQVNTGIRDSVLEVGPFKVTVSDLLATLPLGTLSAKETQKIKEEIPSFVDGWLTDMIVDATLWKLRKLDQKILCC